MINNIEFVLGNGNLGRPLPGFDYVSGYPIWSSTVPSGFLDPAGSTPIVKQIFSVADVEALGITNDYSDETKATAKLVVTATGSTGDLMSLTITEPSINSTVNIYTINYYAQASDTTTTTLASNLATTISASGTGYQATSAGATVSVTARPGMGIALNSGTVLTATYSGTAAFNVNAQFTGGVAGSKAVWHYQISEYFRLNPNGKIWVKFYTTGPSTFSELNDLQSEANGEIRQFMVYSGATTSSSMMSEIDKVQARCEELFDNYTPASVIYAADFSRITDLSTLPNVRSKSDNYVSVLISQDGGKLGAFLALTTGKAVPTLGACLGALSYAKVSEDIAWVQKFNISDGSECETVAFSNGKLWNSLYATSKTLLNQLDNYGYVFLKKLNNVSGTYFNDSHCAVSITSDYAYIENNRTISKAVRNAYLELAPLIAGPIYFNADGTMNDISIATYENASKPSLDAMIQNGELSGYSITVDRTVNVQTTGKVVLTIKLLGVGVARNIQVSIGFALSL